MEEIRRLKKKRAISATLIERKYKVLTMSADRRKYANFVSAYLKEKTTGKRNNIGKMNKLRAEASIRWKTMTYLEKLTFLNKTQVQTSDDVQ